MGRAGRGLAAAGLSGLFAVVAFLAMASLGLSYLLSGFITYG